MKSLFFFNKAHILHPPAPTAAAAILNALRQLQCRWRNYVPPDGNRAFVPQSLKQRFHLGSCALEAAFRNNMHSPRSVGGCK